MLVIQTILQIACYITIESDQSVSSLQTRQSRTNQAGQKSRTPKLASKINSTELELKMEKSARFNLVKKMLEENIFKKLNNFSIKQSDFFYFQFLNVFQYNLPHQKFGELVLELMGTSFHQERVNNEIQMWSISRDIHASKSGNWSDQPSRGNWPGSEHRGLTVRNLLFVWVVSQPFFQYSRKEGEMYGCTGVLCVQKSEKTKNENEAIRHR